MVGRCYRKPRPSLIGLGRRDFRLFAAACAPRPSPFASSGAGPAASSPKKNCGGFGCTAAMSRARAAAAHVLPVFSGITGKSLTGGSWRGLRDIGCPVSSQELLSFYAETVLPSVRGFCSEPAERPIFSQPNGMTDALKLIETEADIPGSQISAMDHSSDTKLQDKTNGPCLFQIETTAVWEGFAGTLAEKALLAVLPPESEFPYTVRVNSEVMASDDSTSMASVCGGRMALMDAGIPVREHVADVSVGLVSEVDPTTGDISSYRILTDILGLEDHLGDMDFKIAGTRKGITAIQLDIKPTGIPLDIICENLEPAQKARNQILDCMDQEISSARAINDGSSPRLATLSFSSDSLRKLLFHKKGIERETGARVSVSDGTVTIVAKTQPIIDKALEKVEFLVGREIEVGKTYKGTVSSIKEYGAFVEFNGGQHDLLHISELSHEPVSKVSYVVSVGQMLSLICIGQDVRGNIKLSLKATLPHLPKKKDLASKDADCLPSQGVVGWMAVENMPSKNADVEPSIDTPACSMPSVIIRSAAGCDAQDGHTEKRSKVANSSPEKHSKVATNRCISMSVTIPMKVTQLKLVNDVTHMKDIPKSYGNISNVVIGIDVPIPPKVPHLQFVGDISQKLVGSTTNAGFGTDTLIPVKMPQL
ncbi:hypothetical protein GUJ93_ZPchr0007g4674 [Zizania palustris]|uniref:polyribonucleotide nucleotidyltransferase n=1 Tax=Zizania palustris TaxID=103762 RepID=A0A8J5TDZ3_ZIZPA|nr:hypothetical protein GUJ93_ZPchr0007g4674 [Zizania palustris]